MTDIVSPEKRSQMMSGIGGKNTKPELGVRTALHRLGYRYRLHGKQLPGKPDLVFRKFNAVIFIHGCFWHGHNCNLFKWPKSNAAFWKKKITGNRTRDIKNIHALHEHGWRTAIIWECGTRKPDLLNETIKHTVDWLENSTDHREFPVLHEPANTSTSSHSS